jgi:hypothetical protein
LENQGIFSLIYNDFKIKKKGLLPTEKKKYSRKLALSGYSRMAYSGF